MKDHAPAIYLECAFVLATTGAAMIYPPAALFIASCFLFVLAYLIDRRAPGSGPDDDEGSR